MITKKSLGKHQDVLTAEFGTGAISFSRARHMDEKHETMLIFHNNTEQRNIGEVCNKDSGKTTDELSAPEFVLRFTKPESITALIHSLVELQKEVFEYQRQLVIDSAVPLNYCEKSI